MKALIVVLTMLLFLATPTFGGMAEIRYLAGVALEQANSERGGSEGFDSIDIKTDPDRDGFRIITVKYRMYRKDGAKEISKDLKDLEENWVIEKYTMKCKKDTCKTIGKTIE